MVCSQTATYNNNTMGDTMKNCYQKYIQITTIQRMVHKKQYTRRRGVFIIMDCLFGEYNMRRMYNCSKYAIVFICRRLVVIIIAAQ